MSLVWQSPSLIRTGPRITRFAEPIPRERNARAQTSKRGTCRGGHWPSAAGLADSPEATGAMGPVPRGRAMRAPTLRPRRAAGPPPSPPPKGGGLFLRTSLDPLLQEGGKPRSGRGWLVLLHISGGAAAERLRRQGAVPSIKYKNTRRDRFTDSAGVLFDYTMIYCSRAYRRSSSRASGWAMRIRARVRSLTLRPRRWAMPYSVTT